jgi:hypothetical protein
VAPWDQVALDDIEKLVIIGQRPEIPPTSHNVESDESADDSKFMSDLIQACWSQDPNDRPAFSEILETLSTHHHTNKIFIALQGEGEKRGE